MKTIYTILLLFFSSLFYAYTPNSFGTVGLNLTPTARFFDEGSIGFGLSRHEDFSRTDLIAQPYDWLEVSIFYADIPARSYPASLGLQSYKDKGFNMKILLSKETKDFPQIALGLSDFAGTGLFSSEYIVGSKSIGNFDISLGVGWGLYADGISFQNPMKILSNKFDNRNTDYESTQGKFDGADLFSGSEASLFTSINYKIGNDNIFIESNPTAFEGRLESVTKRSKAYIGYNKNFLNGLDFKISIGTDKELNINFSTDFNYSKIKSPDFKEPSRRYDKPTIDLIAALQTNGIALKKLQIDDEGRLLLSVRQNAYQNVDDSNLNIQKALNYSGINSFDEVIVSQYHFGEEINKDGFRVIDGKKIAHPIKTTVNRSIYESEEEFPNTTFNLTPSLRTLLASREGFLYYGLMLEANFDMYFSEKLYVSSKTVYSLTDNFDGLFIGPVTTYPAQVRSDIKDYLKNLGDKPSIERLELNYLEKKSNNFFMFKAGILETMFSGYGFEYLNFKETNNFAFGFDLFDVKKRGYEYDFSTLDYEVVTGHVNFFHYFDPLKLTTHISWGKYLAGDKGFTFDFSRRFQNGTTFGAFFSLTDVSFDQFGEGSFDKGVYVSVPIGTFGKNMSGFRWTPLTKDPAQKLNLSSRIFGNLSRYIY